MSPGLATPSVLCTLTTMCPGRTPALEAVLFDLDGTLIDSMSLHYRAYRDVLADEGAADLSRARFDASVGGRYTEAIPLMVDGPHEESFIERVHDHKVARLRELLDSVEIPVLPTARLLGLYGLVSLGLVTSGARASVDPVLARLGWGQTFDVVVTSDDVMAGKPAPDPYALAVASLGVEAHRCLVFEDTDAGVCSAQHAGLDVVDVRGAGAG